MEKTNLKKPYLFILVIILMTAALLILKAKKDQNLKTKEKSNIQIQVTPTPIKNETYIVSTPQDPALSGFPVMEIPLEIYEPQEGVAISSSLTIKGKTKPNASVFVNDKELRANKEGLFSTRLSLDEGENTIVILAHDADGKYAEKEITVTLDEIE